MDQNEFQQRQPIELGQVERMGSIGVGTALLLMGTFRKGLMGMLFQLGGAALIVRGASAYRPVQRALGHSGEEPTGIGRYSTRVESMIDVDRPADELYRIWRDFENLPAFMNHLQSVRVDDPVRSHWVAKGPAGTVIRWDAVVINDIENELIAWETLEGSSIDHAGSVHFERLGERSTRVRVVLRYTPPANALGDAVAKAFHTDPQTEIDEDLKRFKAMIEGTTARTAELR